MGKTTGWGGVLPNDLVERAIQSLIDEIRADKKIGRGSCSSLDECQTDEELRESIKQNLADGAFRTVKSGLAFYKKCEREYQDYAAEIRSTAF